MFVIIYRYLHRLVIQKQSVPKLVVCLTGMPGAGKSTIVSKLKEQGYETFNLGDGVRAEAKRQNLDPTGENLGKMIL